jgi:lipid II:glycine glycyltransferase (peptidoglycan interpeptide bridge formation enzyme)
MSAKLISHLPPTYAAEFDNVDESGWYELSQMFDDANIYQTWAYAAVVGGKRRISRMVLRKEGEVVAIAMARIAKVPLMRVGIAYVMWGPLWRRNGTQPDPEIFRQAVRALRNEYMSRRGLVLRLFPLLHEEEGCVEFSGALDAEGFSLAPNRARGRTILMDLKPSLDDLKSGLTRHWARELKRAEKKELEIVDSLDSASFTKFVAIYKEMVSRKKFVEPNDIQRFAQIQEQLPELLKMKLLLCKSQGEVVAGVLCATIGTKAVLLFAATSNAGMKTGGSYLLQWKFVELAKQLKLSTYDLNGINPDANPGTYEFKHGLAGSNGRDLFFLGRFDSRAPWASQLCLNAAETLHTIPGKLGRARRAVSGSRPFPRSAQ